MDSKITALEAQLSKGREVKAGMRQELLTGRIRRVCVKRLNFEIKPHDKNAHIVRVNARKVRFIKSREQVVIKPSFKVGNNRIPETGNCLLIYSQNGIKLEMHLITRQKLKQFWEEHPSANGALQSWAKEVEHANWKSPNDIKSHYRSADPIGDNRVVFNIKGNTYRLVVKFHYNTQIAFVRFVGTHEEYNKIDAEKI